MLKNSEHLKNWKAFGLLHGTQSIAVPYLHDWASPMAQWVKNLPTMQEMGDAGSTPGSGRSPGERNGNPLPYSCQKNPMDRGVWRATVSGVTESDRAEQLSMSTICMIGLTSVSGMLICKDWLCWLLTRCVFKFSPCFFIKGAQSCSRSWLFCLQDSWDSSWGSLLPSVTQSSAESVMLFGHWSTVTLAWSCLMLSAIRMSRLKADEDSCSRLTSWAFGWICEGSGSGGVFVFCLPFCLFDSEESAVSCRALKSGKSNDGRVVKYWKVEGSQSPSFCLSSIESKAGPLGRRDIPLRFLHSSVSVYLSIKWA